ncbi:class I SAM-dependent methyltransferase [Oceanobacillus locisalsi]|uniref:Class I SAM-dependent methyltransferase n=1 Tax=Oceanobacillus locisalsi TaxID=546107 RepID=A0ABW3NGM2_9BACI
MNHWDKKFNTNEYVYGKAPNEFLKEMHNKHHFSGEALAIAEGEGRNAVFLAEEGLDVTAWDSSKEGIKKMQNLADERKVHVDTENIDLNQADWAENKWDEVVCIYGHFHSELRHNVLENVKRSIKPGGYYVSEVYSMYQIPYQSGGPQDEDMLYTPQEILEAFRDWKIIHFFMGEVERNEGKFHSGTGHIIQIVAQKPA